MMKNIMFIIPLLFYQTGLAQRHEFGGRIGSSNLIGDIGNTQYLQFASEGIARTPLSVGISYKRNFNPYQGVKLSLSYHSTYFDDYKSKELYRRNRGTLGSNNIVEGALTFEYNFFPINNEVREPMWSPYIFAGIAGIAYDTPEINYTIKKPHSEYIITQEIARYRNAFSGGIPFGIGLKYKFNYNWTIYGEATFRPTFTDNLDFNNPENFQYQIIYKDIPEQDIPSAKKAFDQYIENHKVGNLNSKDWLNSVSIGVSYSFGRPPCYCD